jgi:flagellar hook protein FlgE
MLLSLDSGVSALDQFQQQLNVIGNNIANVNTVGFKASDVNFADALSQTLGSNSAGSMQVGSGVLTASITHQFTQGSITSTGVSTDLAVNGSGFFLVKDPSTGASYVTRDGNFSVDTSGYLVTSNGMRAQGYSDTGLTTQGDIKIDNTGATTTTGGVTTPDSSPVQSYTFGADGKLNVELADGTQFTRGQLLLQNFTSPAQLMSVGNNLYSGLSNAGPLTAPVAPNSNGLGALVAGSLEMSNVDLAGQLTDLITAQRAYEANAKVITTSDQILQDLNNLGR